MILGPGTALDPAAYERVSALAELYAIARQRLVEIEAAMRGESYRRTYLQERIREANRIIDELLHVQGGELTGAVADWAREAFPEVYGYGAQLALFDLRAQGVAPASGSRRIHTQAVSAVLDRYVTDSLELVLQLKENTLRSARIVLAQAGLGDEIAAGLIGGLTRRDVSAMIVRRLKAAAEDALPEGQEVDLTSVEIKGRRWRMDAYAEMHARTETARVSTAGTRVVCFANGVGYVQVTSHAHAPCICTPYEGRIYALAQGDPRFPWVGILPNGGCPMHPNCVHREAPAVLSFLEARGEVDGRDTIPADFAGKSPREIAKLVRDHRSQLAPYSEDPSGMLPASFRLRAEPESIRRRRPRRTARPTRSPAVPAGFTPASTLQEAEAFAQRLGVQARFADGGRHALAVANAHNEVLQQVAATGLPLPASVVADAAVFQTFRMTAAEMRATPAAYVAARDTIYLNPRSSAFHEGMSSVARDARQQHRIGFWSTSSPLHVFRHEYGHPAHYHLDEDVYAQLRAVRLTDEERGWIRGKVGIYASESPQEFVAEVFAALLDGKTFDGEVMTLYRRFGGPEPLGGGA